MSDPLQALRKEIQAIRKKIEEEKEKQAELRADLKVKEDENRKYQVVVRPYTRARRCEKRDPRTFLSAYIPRQADLVNQSKYSKVTQLGRDAISAAIDGLDVSERERAKNAIAKANDEITNEYGVSETIRPSGERTDMDS
jgi:hypothetical protein